MELEAGVADGVGQVPPHAAPLRPGRTRDRLHLEELSCRSKGIGYSYSVIHSFLQIYGAGLNGGPEAL